VTAVSPIPGGTEYTQLSSLDLDTMKLEVYLEKNELSMKPDSLMLKMGAGGITLANQFCYRAGCDFVLMIVCFFDPSSAGYEFA